MASNDSGVDISNDSSEGNTINNSIEFDGILNNDSQHHHQQQEQQHQQNIENKRQAQEMQQSNTPTSTTSTTSTTSSSALSEFVLPTSITFPTTIKKLTFTENFTSEESNFWAVNSQKPGGKMKIAMKSYKLHMNSPFGMVKEKRLHMAASTCNVATLTLLLERGFSPNCFDEHKRSPLHVASCRGYVDIVTTLLKYGANPNIVDSLGNTPLHLAVVSANSENFNEVVRILLKSGASVHIRDKRGKNPLELAESKLRLMRTRYKSDTTPEIKKILEDMLILISLILHHFCKEQRDMDELNALEQRLQGLSTSDTDQVENEVDSLLANVERLSMSK